MSDFSYGVSFSTKYAKELELDWREAYLAMLTELPFARVRLMSYWDDIEKSPSTYDFDDLDWQIQQAKKHHVKVTLCLGMRQPRWPECHIPKWVKGLSVAERHDSLYKFIEEVVRRYEEEKIIESWQLENEALNKGIGLCEDYDRKRLRTEYDLVKKLDPSRPIIMSTSNTAGLPLRRPRPNIVGFSIYSSQYRNDEYHFSKLPALWFRFRKLLARILLRSPVIIHELQAEPWGPVGTGKLSKTEQAKSMDAQKLLRNIAYAQKTGISHTDLWGVEWWYWHKTKYNDSSCWDVVKDFLSPGK